MTLPIPVFVRTLLGAAFLLSTTAFIASGAQAQTPAQVVQMTQSAIPSGAPTVPAPVSRIEPIGPIAPVAPIKPIDPAVSLPMAAAGSTASRNASDTEVLEFFSYACPHCAAVEPGVIDWAAQLPPQVKLSFVPVAWNDSMKDMQRLFFTLMDTHRMDLHLMVFKAIHVQKQPLYTEPVMADWTAQHGIASTTFARIFTSSAVAQQVEAADALSHLAEIHGTPTFIIRQGKTFYRIAPKGLKEAEDVLPLAQKTLDVLLGKAPASQMPAQAEKIDLQ